LMAVPGGRGQGMLRVRCIRRLQIVLHALGGLRADPGILQETANVFSLLVQLVRPGLLVRVLGPRT
jgi:hypothetical protein